MKEEQQLKVWRRQNVMKINSLICVSLQEMVLYMTFFLPSHRHRNILPVTFHCSGDTSVTAMLIFVIFERHRMV